ncbi:MAG: hypothetical protein WA814_04425 [Candidatus Baltobacteraceae bacterium]
MDPLQRIQAKIADFPGYSNDLDRRRSDEFVRSYLGEALAELEPRLGTLAPAVQQQIDALLLRVGFADQRAFSAHGDGADVSDEDDGIVGLADRARSLDAGSLPSYLDEVSAALDRRDAVLRAAVAPSP